MLQIENNDNLIVVFTKEPLELLVWLSVKI